MKRIHYLLFILIILNSCSSDNEQTPNQNNDPDPNLVLNITNFTAKINTPIQTRDYSYHNDGYYGIFENPDNSKIFNGNISVSYDANSTQLNINDIQLTWRSSIDGILFEGNPSDSFESEIEETLTKGVHTIFLEASIPSENLTAKDSIILSNNLKLTALNTGKSVKLNWTQYEGNDFVSYKIYSEDFNPIAEISNINTLEYDVTSYSSLVEDKKYQIIVETNGNYNHIIGSNIESMHPGVFIDFPYYISKIIKDPSRTRLYALVGNKNYESDVYGLLVINSETFEIDSHILQDDLFADLDISPDEQFLFLCQHNVEKITKVNLNSLESSSFEIDVDGGIGIHKIEVGNSNVLYCHRTPPTSGSSQFYIYNGNTGNLINGPTSSNRHGDIELNNQNNSLYAGTSNTSDGRLYKHNTDGSSINFDSYYPGNPTNGYPYPEPFILLSDDNQSLFWENFQFDLDLNVIRTFNTNIKACSPNNNYLADFDKIYNYSDLSVVCEYPEFPEGIFVSSTIAFSDDNNLIYCWANQLNTRYPPDPYYRAQTYIFKFEIE